MTDEELKEYNKLSQNGKDAYNTGMRIHPEWSHKQAMTYATIVIMTQETPLPPGPDPITFKEIYKNIIIKAQQFIQKDFPRIYQQVKDYFVQAIDWLTNAVNVTLNKIIDFFK